MQTWNSRLNSIFAQLIFVLGILLIGNWLSSYLFQPDPPVSIDFRIERLIPTKFRPEYFVNVPCSKEMDNCDDEAQIYFDLETGFKKKRLTLFFFFFLILFFFKKIDLTSLFNWNTKQVFAYLSVEYVTSKNVVKMFFFFYLFLISIFYFFFRK